MGMTAEAIEARRAYQREYRKKNRERINSRKRNWQSENRPKIQEYNRNYWQGVAERRLRSRASFAELGISDTRRRELQEIVRTRQYDDLVVSAAYKADRNIAEYILMSVRKEMSYDALKIRWELKEIEQMPCSRTDFYSKRRLFFYYLDVALKEMQAKELNV